MFNGFESFLKNLNLRQRFTVLLSLVFIGGVILSGTALANFLHYQADQQVTSKALMLIETMNALRKYTNSQVTPELSERLKTEFVPSSVPSYSAREVFENLRSQQAYNQFFYKEATLNPTNLRDKVDDFESKVVEQLRQDRNLKELNGFHSSPTGELFYVARPLVISEASCLQCHSTPDKAPPSLIERYGSANGFGWKLNEIIGAQFIYVPASQVYQSARQSFLLVMGIVIGIFAVAIFLVNFSLNRYVVRPLKRMAHVAEAVSTGELNAEFDQKSNDEVGILAAAFTRMKTSLEMAMKRLGKYRTNPSGSDE